MGRLSYIQRFIPGLAATMSAFTPLLKKGKPYEWSKECRKAYQQVQQMQQLGLCLPKITMAEKESPIYYVSRQLRGAETKYPKAELLCLALVYAAQRLQHYFLAHKLQLIMKFNPVRAIRGQAVINMLALFPEIEESTLSKEVLQELPKMVAVATKEEP
ncbi:unnamed protein product [Prunus armeniaca]